MNLLKQLVLTVACASTAVTNTYADVQPLMTMDMVHHNPGEAPTKSRYLDPGYLHDAGFGAKVFFLFDAAQFGIDWSDFDPTVFPIGSESKEWVHAKADSITSRYNAAKAAGLKVYCMLDMLVLPGKLVENHRAEITDKDGKIDITRPFTQRCVRHLIRSMFATFPQLDGLIIRTGETYLHDAPFHVGNHPVRHGMEDHVTLINLLREEVCENLGKNLIYRTWDMGQLHSLPQHYLSVTEKVEPHPCLYFSIKHTMTDFWRSGISPECPAFDSFDTYWLDESGKYGVPFNPCLGIGHHKQIAEVQCQREYEGKGAHPNYVAHGVIDGFCELTGSARPYALSHLIGNGLFSGVWTWSRGGGWGGPYIPNELWIDLNARVMARWGANPARSEEECFNEVVLELGLPETDLPAFRRLCLLTEEGILKGQYSSFGGSYVNWTRDDTLTGEAFMNGYLSDIIRKNAMQPYLQEKLQAAAIWHEIERLSQLVHFPDESTDEFVKVSSTYGRIKYDILATAWQIMLHGKNTEINGIPFNREEMDSLIATYDTLWEEWNTLHDTHSCCPSLYKAKASFFGNEIGMDATIDRYRHN